MSKNDNKIKQMLEVIETKRANLGTKPRVSYQTSAIFRYDDSHYFNLNTVCHPSVLVKALSFLLSEQRHTREASDRLGVECPEYEWDGFTAKAWEDDFRQRLALIEYNQKAKELAALEVRLKGLVSQDGKTEMELDEISEILA